MMRVVTVWSGAAGMPGYTNMFFDGFIEGAGSAASVADRVRTFWDAIKVYIPSVITLTVQPSVAQINPGTGALQDDYPLTTAPVAVVGTGAGPYTAPAGACINWKTNTVIAGKKLRGKTYVVPLSGGSYDSAGTLLAGALTTLNAAAVTLR